MIISNLTSILKRCETIHQIKQIHVQILTNGLTHLHHILFHQLLVSNSDSYHYHSILPYAPKIFDQLPEPDVFSWACFIRFFAHHGRFKDAITLYVRMHQCGSHPSTFTVSAALRACARIPVRVVGLEIHAQVFKYGFDVDVYVQTALVDLYSKLGDMGTAQRVFDEMPERNVVSWNSILSGFLKSGDLVKAQSVFNKIPKKDVISWNSMISGYARVGDMKSAGSLFGQMPEQNSASWNAMISGYAEHGNMVAARRFFNQMPVRSNVSWITMISGYSKCGDVDSAREIFDKKSEKDLLLWNAMISCYAHNSQPKEAIQLFNEMRKPNVDLQPDEMTLACVISSCSQLGDLRFGVWIELYMRQVGIEMDDHLATALIDLYAKCGCIDKAYKFFNGLKKRDVVAYSAMILGCGINGKPLDAIQLFEEMKGAKIQPNAVTFTGILTAYNHAGLVDEGYRCFNSITREHKQVPSGDHYGIMVDLLGRAGNLYEAYELIKQMPMQPHAGVWGALLLACRLHSNVELGEIAARHCIELEPDTSGYYSLLANIYASAERWDDAKKLRKVMEEKRLTKIPGCSWMESAQLQANNI